MTIFFRVKMVMIYKGIAGLNHAGRTESGVRRFIWVVIFLGGLFATLHSVTSVVEDFLSYPVETTVSFHTPSNVIQTNQQINQLEIRICLFFKLPFPTVTICNQNRVDCDKVSQTLELCSNNNSNSCPIGQYGLDMVKGIGNICSNSKCPEKNYRLN